MDISTKVFWLFAKASVSKILNFNQMKALSLYADVIVSIG